MLSPIRSKLRGIKPEGSKIGYRIKGDLTTGFALGKIIISYGDFIVKATVENETAYCTEKAAYIDPLSGPSRTVCFVDANNDGSFELLKAAPGAFWFDKEVVPQLLYEKSEVIYPDSDSFKYELLYQGTSKGTLNMSYREYKNDFARPAFFQDVSYDISSMPVTVTFRTVRIEILGADNNQINYRVLSKFD